MNEPNLEWDKDALDLLDKIPFFVRKAAKKKIERTAKESGEARITVKLMERIRSERSN